MADNIISDTFGQVFDGGEKVATSGGFNWFLIIGIIFGLAIIATVGAFLYFYYYEKKNWNIITRVHYENPAIDGVSIGLAVPTKRIRFKDGRVVYMYKTAIQGYTISPELLTWSKPREHDIIVTQDKKVFCIIGIDSIDAQRKMLKVDVSYPDIEMDRQDLQQHIDSKKFDDPNERFKIIAKIALYIFIIIGIIVLVVLGGKTYIDGKELDVSRDQINLKTAEYQTATISSVNQFILILSKVMPQSFKAIDGQDLLLNLTVST